MNPNISEKEKQDFNELLEKLRNDYQYNIEKFDKQSIYLASGALAISLTFVKDIVPLKNLICLCLYYCAISAFTLSIIVGFISYLIASELIYRQRTTIKKFVDNGEQGKVLKDRYTRNLLFVNAGLIVLGIFLLVIFTIVNLNHAV